MSPLFNYGFQAAGIPGARLSARSLKDPGRLLRSLGSRFLQDLSNPGVRDQRISRAWITFAPIPELCPGRNTMVIAGCPAALCFGTVDLRRPLHARSCDRPEGGLPGGVCRRALSSLLMACAATNVAQLSARYCFARSGLPATRCGRRLLMFALPHMNAPESLHFRKASQRFLRRTDETCLARFPGYDSANHALRPFSPPTTRAPSNDDRGPLPFSPPIDAAKHPVPKIPATPTIEDTT